MIFWETRRAKILQIHAPNSSSSSSTLTFEQPCDDAIDVELVCLSSALWALSKDLVGLHA